MPRKHQPTQQFIAATTLAVTATKNGIQLFPYGEFRATDGRPTDIQHWIIADENGQDIVDLANRYNNKLVIDYEHQTIHAADNGQPAPAAGWMDYFYLTPQGVFAEVTWTDKAKQMIKNGEYKYISPVFIYDSDGYVRKILHAALTNNPALDGMQEAIAACFACRDELTQLSTKEENKMELLELLKTLLNLPDADEARVQAALTQLKDRAAADNIPLTEVYDRVESLSNQQVTNTNDPDPAKFVPVDVVQQLQTQVAKLTSQINEDKSEALITAALSAGKLLPAQKKWAEDLAQKDIAELENYLSTVEPIAALTGNQTAGNAGGDDDSSAALSPEQLAVCRSLGYAEAEFKQILKED